MNYEKIIRTLPELRGRILSVQILKGGLTNKNFLIDTDFGRLVARFAPTKSGYLGMNKKYEFNHYEVAASLGIGPKPLKFYPKFGLLIVEYLEGQVLNQATIRSVRMIKKLAELFKKMHKGPKFKDSIDLFDITRKYHQTARGLRSWMPTDTPRYLQNLDQIEKELKNKKWIKPSHLDLMVENVINTRDGIKLIDWEYSANADCRFDLANISFKANFSEQQDKLLLKCYGQSSLTIRQLQLMKCVVALREAGWSWVQIKLSKINFDYKRYGMKHINEFKKLWRELNP